MPEKERLKLEVKKDKMKKLREERLDKEKTERDQVKKNLKRQREELEQQEREEDELSTQRSNECLQRAAEIKMGQVGQVGQGEEEVKRAARPTVCYNLRTPALPDRKSIDDALQQAGAALSSHSTRSTHSTPFTFSSLSLDDVKNMASTRMFYSSTESGFGMIGEGAQLPHPGDWTNFLSKFETLMLERKRNNVDYKFGEYNYVVSYTEIEKHIKSAPVLCDSDGNLIDPSNVVFRITRPDSDNTEDEDDEDDEDEKDEKDEKDDEKDKSKSKKETKKKISNGSRYRTYDAVCSELNFILKAAANGYGVPCYTAFAFASPFIETDKNGRKERLYGLCCAFQKAHMDFGSFLTERISSILRRPPSLRIMEKGLANLIHNSVLPVFVKQANDKVLNLDAKPSNTVVISSTSIRMIDFDPSLYCLHAKFADFETLLFVNMLVFLSHIRAFFHSSFANAFIGVLRPLLAELSVHARGCQWLQDAQITTRKFKSKEIHSNVDAKEKLEAVIYSYYIQREACSSFVTRPRFKGDSKLLPQLLSFVLTGRTTCPADAAVKQLVGEI